MSTLADHIERHLRAKLARAENGTLETQRGSLARRFNCVPSQISYVLETRFTVDKGFLVESRRGGGGYIRIINLTMGSGRELVERVSRQVGDEIDQQRAFYVIGWLESEGYLTEREAAALRAASARESIPVQLPVRDVIRARVLMAALRAMLGRGDNPPGADGRGATRTTLATHTARTAPMAGSGPEGAARPDPEPHRQETGSGSADPDPARGQASGKTAAAEGSRHKEGLQRGD